MPIDAARQPPGISFLGLVFSPYTLDEVVQRIGTLRGSATFCYIVTPNVHHTVMLNAKARSETLEAFRSAYAAADLRLCDSRILARLARLFGLRLPIAPGSDLTALMFQKLFKPGDRVAVIGGHIETLALLNARFPGPEYVQHIPPFGVLTNGPAMQAAATFVAKAEADYALFAIGSPQGEILAQQCAQSVGARGVGVSIGASIDFLIGDQVRAPLWAQRAGLEWAHRLMSNPKRMWRRYLVEGPRIFWIAALWGFHRRTDVTQP